MPTPSDQLDSREHDVWMSCLALSHHLEGLLDRRLHRDVGIPLGYYLILSALAQAPDHTLRMSDLAVATYSSQSRLSHAVNRLEESGWVRRIKCPTDGRGQFAVLTDEGQALVSAAAPGHAAVIRQFFLNRLRPEQLDQLAEICDAVLGGSLG